MKYTLSLLFTLFAFYSFSQEDTNPKNEIKEIVEINEDSDEVPFAVIEEVPIYSGCNGANANNKSCLLYTSDAADD